MKKGIKKKKANSIAQLHIVNLGITFIIFFTFITFLLSYFYFLFFMTAEILCVKYCSTQRDGTREIKQYCVFLPCSGTVDNRI